jgi:hypothetical protein
MIHPDPMILQQEQLKLTVAVDSIVVLIDLLHECLIFSVPMEFFAL